MIFALLLAADEPAQGAGGSPISMFLPLVLIVVAFYFVMVLPMRKQEKQRKALIAALKKSDKILNSGGIIGIVEGMKDQEDEVLLRGGIKITKSSIVKVFTPEETAKEQKAGGA